MKKYITYKCNQCKRTIDKQINNLQPFIDKCDITLNCRGKLKPIFVKSTRNLRASSSDLQDWMPKDIDLVKETILDQVTFTNLANSFDNHLVLAVEQSDEFLSTINLVFSVQKENNFNYSEFTYYTNPETNSISGKDSSNSGLILKYSVSDEIEVFVNGKQYIENLDFTRSLINDEGYIINFNSTLRVKSTVKIIVYKQQEILKSNPLEFKINAKLNLVDAISWGNIEKISFNNKNYLIYICSDITAIGVNARLNLYPAENSLDLDKCFFLLSKPNFSAVDRNISQVIPLNNLIEDNTYVKINIKDGKYYCAVTTAAIIDLYPIINYLQFKSNDIEYVKDSSTIATEIEVINSNKFIIGEV